MSTAPDELFLRFQQALAGRYSIDRELGRGGMGIVYLAREVHLDRSVAIKLLPPDLAKQPTLRDRFLREARLAAKLSHPNIIPIFAVEETNAFVYYVMAFVDGETLAQRVRTRGPLSASEGARVLREVAWALAYAHDHGIVHRDIKPDNILLEGNPGRVLVADFGIAAAAGVSADGVSGTPEFMSPEQVLGKPLDARSDLYSLGATAFYAFSGQFVFDAGGATEMLAKHVAEAPKTLALAGASVPRKLSKVIEKCLAKDPAQRPASAEALAEQLGVALAQRRELPVALRAFVKRNGRMNGGGTLISGIALLGGSIGMSYLFGSTAGYATFAAAATLGPLAFGIAQASTLLRQGFAHRDLAPAFKSEIDQTREELASSEKQWKGGKLDRYLPAFTRATWITAAASFGAVLIGSNMFQPWRYPVARELYNALVTILLISTLTGSLSLLALLTHLQRATDVDSLFWGKLWNGRIGRFVFSLAKRLTRGQERQTAMTHRATELSLGMAAEQLYESLPKETRAALSDLPDILQRLQEDAQALRKRYEDISDALNGVNDSSSVEYTQARALRDDIHRKLGDAVGALETIRLNLLRLHAGSTSVESLTTHLGIAAEVSEEVERIIAAHEELERGLAFPREAEATPV